MNAQAILLDLDNTLYNYQTTHAKALDVTLKFLSKKSKRSYKEWKENYSTARKSINNNLHGTAASHNRLLYFQRACELMAISPFKYAEEANKLYWDTFLKHMTLYPGINNLLKLIGNKKVCLITDLTADVQYKKIKKLKLDRYIHCLVTSEEAGVEKPHPLIFKLALKKLDVSNRSVIMIGDDFKKDILGASKLKIKSYWLNLERQSIQYKKSPLIQECRSVNELIRHLSV